ncbi:HNH endonuclease signature motif containing protein [Streptomyces sp. DSM 44917]|uniref:HNH endonuclease signature motif containing protein n=1 Tax=Streptomyces boetiae TaxID=3075541 RepID=A0ABU2L8I9_9ACTN|nr:HNH endonuclease signature motif containing protein [Streptomyces sp. DSM 44917]MDT0307812.1 HNH endonuclease signature motif containing protein [Streptomyces sp. DSM 44917]
MLAALDLPDTRRNRAQVYEALRERGTSAPRLLGQAHRRGRPAANRLPADLILTVREPGSPRVKRALPDRALKEKGVAEVCAECGTGNRWRGKPLVLEIDHVNGDRLDNRLANLRYLCPSCHSQARPAGDAAGAPGPRDGWPVQ